MIDNNHDRKIQVISLSKPLEIKEWIGPIFKYMKTSN